MYVYGVLVDLLFHVVYYSKLSPVWGARLCAKSKGDAKKPRKL